MQRVIYVECRYAECRYTECHYAECHHTESRGASDRIKFQKMLNPLLKVEI